MAVIGPLPDRILLPMEYDCDALLQDLAAVDKQSWIPHFVSQNYQGDWSVIPLRGPADASHPVMMSYSDPACQDFADTPYMQHCRYIRQVLADFACPLQSVRLMKLSPGSDILTHSDHDLSAETGSVRLHIPIVTNPKVRFYLNDRLVEMAAGQCWYLRLSDPHSVNNDGDTDRVHLVIDASVNDWLLQQLQNASQRLATNSLASN